MPTCHSTNEVASELLKKGDVDDGTLVISDKQTAGKGQQGNVWESQPELNLTFSLVLRPRELEVKNHFMLNVISSLAIRAFIASKCNEKVNVKWPNDVYIGSEKIAGILIRNVLKSSFIESSVIGMGININQTSFKTDNATSLKLCSGQHYLLGECLEQLVLEFEKFYFKYLNKSHKQLIEEYQNNLFWRDEVHTFEGKGKYFSGIIKGVNDLGQLHIEVENGNEYFNFKEVSFVN